MHRKVFLALVAVGCLCATAYANPTITVGNYILLPNLAGQKITIEVKGDDAVTNVNLAMQVADGVTAASPLITAVDLYVDSSLMMFPNNSGVQGESVTLPEHYSYSGIATNTGTVVAGDGSGGQKNLAIITISTAGLFAGSGPWTLVANLPLFETGSDFGGPFPTPITIDGSLSIVPEPSSVVLGIFAAAGLGAVAIRRRRKKSA